MATTRKLVFDFTCEDGKEHKFSFNYADSNAGVNNVKALADALVNNGSIFQNVPVTVNTAKIITTSEAEYNLGD